MKLIPVTVEFHLLITGILNLLLITSIHSLPQVCLWVSGITAWWAYAYLMPDEYYPRATQRNLGWCCLTLLVWMVIFGCAAHMIQTNHNCLLCIVILIFSGIQGALAVYYSGMFVLTCGFEL